MAGERLWKSRSVETPKQGFHCAGKSRKGRGIPTFPQPRRRRSIDLEPDISCATKTGHFNLLTTSDSSNASSTDFSLWVSVNVPGLRIWAPVTGTTPSELNAGENFMEMHTLKSVLLGAISSAPLANSGPRREEEPSSRPQAPIRETVAHRPRAGRRSGPSWRGILDRAQTRVAMRRLQSRRRFSPARPSASDRWKCKTVPFRHASTEVEPLLPGRFA